MSDFLKKVQTGQPLTMPAAAYNAFIDAAVDFRTRASQISRDARTSSRGDGIVTVRNASGALQPRFAVMGVDGPVIEPDDNEIEFTNRVTLDVSEPDAAHAGRFVVLVEPLAEHALGRAFALGVCPVRIDVDIDAEDWRFADLAPGETGHLVARHRGPAAILWREGGTGPQWALVRLGAPRPAGVLPVALHKVGGAKGGTGTPDTWRYDIHDAETGLRLAEDIDPVAAPHRWRRSADGGSDPATHGHATWLPDGNGGAELVIGWINETGGAGEDDPDDGGDSEHPELPPCGHPGNDPSGRGGDAEDHFTDHPGDEPGGGPGDHDTDHPGDYPSPPSSGQCP